MFESVDGYFCISWARVIDDLVFLDNGGRSRQVLGVSPRDRPA
jgi:hypothetical protein